MEDIWQHFQQNKKKKEIFLPVRQRRQDAAPRIMCFPPQPKAIARILLQQEKSTHTEATFPSVRETQTQVVCVSIRVVWKCRCNFPMCGCALLVLPTAFPPPLTLFINPQVCRTLAFQFRSRAFFLLSREMSICTTNNGWKKPSLARNEWRNVGERIMARWLHKSGSESGIEWKSILRTEKLLKGRKPR